MISKMNIYEYLLNVNYILFICISRIRKSMECPNSALILRCFIIIYKKVDFEYLHIISFKYHSQCI